MSPCRHFCHSVTGALAYCTYSHFPLSFLCYYSSIKFINCCMIEVRGMPYALCVCLVYIYIYIYTNTTKSFLLKRGRTNSCHDYSFNYNQLIHQKYFEALLIKAAIHRSSGTQWNCRTGTGPIHFLTLEVSQYITED